MTRTLALRFCDLDRAGDAPLPVLEVRARDATGSFAIRPGHADLIAALVPSIVDWRLADGSTAVAAVPGGILRAIGGDRVEVLSPRIYRAATAQAAVAALEAGIARDRLVAAEARRALQRLESDMLHNLLGRFRPPDGGVRASP